MLVSLVVSVCLVLTLCPAAFAQCVMCAQSAQATAEATGGYQPLAIAALILLVPTLLILAAGSYLVWRLREPWVPLRRSPNS